MKRILAGLIILTSFSCIPYKIAPNIKTDKIIQSKKFKRDLPKNYGFIFKDPKEQGDFYNFVNSKFQLNSIDVDYDVPFEVDGNTYFFSYYEREKSTNTINFFPMLLDGALEDAGLGPAFEEDYTSRFGFWYIIITVVDNDLKDCLHPKYLHRKKIVAYLRQMKSEYLAAEDFADTRPENSIPNGWIHN